MLFGLGIFCFHTKTENAIENMFAYLFSFLVLENKSKIFENEKKMFSCFHFGTVAIL